MKRWAAIISAIGLTFAVPGRSSDYIMTTKDGHMTLTDGRPEIDDDAGLMSYHDQQDSAI